MKPTIKDRAKSTIHRDGTISHYNIYKQQWLREGLEQIGDNVLSSWTPIERRKIYLARLSFKRRNR